MTRQEALKHAHESERCQHFHLTGRQCGSPALAGRRLCYFHQRALHPKVPSYKLPLLEDAASVQFGLFQIARALEDKAYDSKTSALLLYALQTASANLRRVQEERECLRRADEREKEGPSTSHESFADIVIRGLGLRPPDAPKQSSAHFDDVDPLPDSQPFPDPLQDALEAEFSSAVEDAADLSDDQLGGRNDHQASAADRRPTTADSVQRRGPTSARRAASNDQRRTTND